MSSYNLYFRIEKSKNKTENNQIFFHNDVLLKITLDDEDLDIYRNDKSIIYDWLVNKDYYSCISILPYSKLNENTYEPLNLDYHKHRKNFMVNGVSLNGVYCICNNGWGDGWHQAIFNIENTGFVSIAIYIDGDLEPNIEQDNLDLVNLSI